MKKTIFALLSLMVLMLASCSDVNIPDAVYSEAPSNLAWTNEGRQLTLNLVAARRRIRRHRL